MLPITRGNLQSFCRACLCEFSTAKEPTHRLNGTSFNTIFPEKVCNSCHLKIVAMKEFQRKTIFSTGILRLIVEGKRSKATMDILIKYCRVCLKRQSNVLHDLRKIPELCLGMLECTLIEIIDEDKQTNLFKVEKRDDTIRDELSFPPALCNRCFATLKSFMEFKNISKQAAEYFENILNASDVVDDAKDNIRVIKQQNENAEKLSISEPLRPLERMYEAVDIDKNQFRIYVAKDLSPVLEAKQEIEIKLYNSFQIESEEYKCGSHEDNGSISNSKDNEDTVFQSLQCGSDEDKKLLSTNKAMTVQEQELESKPDCRKYDTSFRMLLTYEMHAKSVNEGCDKSYASAQKFLQNSNKTYICEYCERIFKRNERLNDHISTVHQKLKPFTCSICSKKFGTKNTLNRHEKNHSNKKPFACEHCGKRYNAKPDLNVHIQRHTRNPELLCHICKRLQPNKEELRKHIERHSKSYQCSKCGKIFKKMVNLREHVDTVHLKQKIKCSFCNLAFSARKSLKNHELCHTSKDWPENCSSCELYFKSKHSLLIHFKKLHCNDLK